MTTEQIRNGTKTVTRRMGWKFLRGGDMVRPIVKGQGLKKGENVEVIRGPLKIMGTQRVRLDDIRSTELEGFPDMSPKEFVKMFCMANNCNPWSYVTRIEFEYTD